MSNHSIIEHRASYYFIRIEEDFLAICSSGKCSPHCKALILAILEHWINTKRARGEGNYVYLTIPQWIKHTYMLYERNVIIDCLKELLDEGMVERRSFKVHDQNTFEYTLNVDAIHERIKRLPSKPDKETMPNLDPYLGYKARAKATRESEKAKKEGVVEKPTQQRIRTQTPNLNSNIDSEERKNDIGQKTSKSYTQESSFLPSSTQSSSCEIVFTPEEQTVYELAEKLHLSYLKRNEKHKTNCAILVEKGVTTLEKMESLLQFCKQRPHLAGKDLNLKNLINELNGWLQLQSQEVSPEQVPETEEPAIIVTDGEMAEDLKRIVDAYQDNSNFDCYLQHIHTLKRQLALSNYDMCDKMANAYRLSMSNGRSIDSFLDHLRSSLY